jgi:hypothetical protein
MGLRAADILVQKLCGLGIAASWRKPADLQDANASVQRDCDYVAELDFATGRVDACAVDAHMAGRSKRRGRRARPHDPSVPQPTIDTLTIRRQTAAPQRRSLAFASS